MLLGPIEKTTCLEWVPVTKVWDRFKWVPVAIDLENEKWVPLCNRAAIGTHF